MSGTPIVLLTTAGRKSAKAHTIPLGAFGHKDGYVVVGSNAGQASHPAWYHNLLSNPRVTVQVQDKVIPATAETLSGKARAQAWKQVIATAPVYAGYQKQTKREIPLVLLRPVK
jgi:deazaflavin-dependent oxidoreductase (nitroreductase family)